MSDHGNGTGEKPKKKSYSIKAADKTIIEIPPGEFYINPKARTRRLMLNSLSKEARQVYACLELGTMGYKQELAVITELMPDGRKRRRPLTPGDISRKTGLLKQAVTRALVELEEAGLAERKSDDGGPLRNGHMLLYSWAVPKRHPASPNNGKGKRARLPFEEWFPPEWSPLVPFIKRLKYEVSIDEVNARDYLLEGKEAARVYQEGIKVVERFLSKICAQPSGDPSIKKETTPSQKGRTERTGDAAAAASSPLPTEPAAAAPSQPSDLELPPSVTPILEAFRPVGGITYTKALHLLRDGGDLTAEEIGAKASEEIPRILVQRKVENKAGLVIHRLEQFFRSREDVKQWRRGREQIADEAASREETERTLREFFRKENP